MPITTSASKAAGVEAPGIVPARARSWRFPRLTDTYCAGCGRAFYGSGLALHEVGPELEEGDELIPVCSEDCVSAAARLYGLRVIGRIGAGWIELAIEQGWPLDDVLMTPEGLAAARAKIASGVK